MKHPTSSPKVVVVGVGHWGKNLVRNFYKLKALKGVYDVDESKMKEILHTYPSVKGYQNYDALLTDPTVTGVVIATPSNFHFMLTKRALLKGKDVFCEKPLTLKVEEGEELVKIAKEKKKILMVGHILKYHPAIVKLKQIIKNKEIGKIHYIYSSRLNLGRVRQEENILWNFAPHDVSVIIFLLETYPLKISAFGGSYLTPGIADITVTHLEFKDGVKAHIFVSWLHPYKEQKLVVIGTKKMVVFDDVSKEHKLVMYPLDKHKLTKPLTTRETITIPIEPTEPLYLECQHFLECIKTRTTPKTDGSEGVEVLRILSKAQKSLEKGNIPFSLSSSYFVHPTATIDEGVEIGEGTKIWHYSHILTGAKIGKNCNIGQNVVIFGGTRVGNNVKIQNNVSVYTGVILEDDVFCGPSMVFTNVAHPRSHVSRKKEYQSTIVKKGATIGANATIVCGVTIHEYAFVGAGAVVTQDVPRYSLVVGVPAKVVGYVCWCGERLKFEGGIAKCKRCDKKYKKEGKEIQEI